MTAPDVELGSLTAVGRAREGVVSRADEIVARRDSASASCRRGTCQIVVQNGTTATNPTRLCSKAIILSALVMA